MSATKNCSPRVSVDFSEQVGLGYGDSNSGPWRRNQDIPEFWIACSREFVQIFEGLVGDGSKEERWLQLSFSHTEVYYFQRNTES